MDSSRDELTNQLGLYVLRSRRLGDALRRALGKPHAAFNLVIALLATVIFSSTFRAGTERGMDQLVAWNGAGRVVNAVATVLTQERFHLGGYALSECICQELENRGLTSNPEFVQRLGLTVPENLRAVYLDKVLTDMERDLPKVPNHCKDAIRGVGADDVGYVDLV